MPNGDSPEPAPVSGAPDLVGRTFARYRVLSRLGVGGMGTVYLAEHTTLHRKTALKVLNPSMARDPDALARFHREARNASTIEHPNVCAVYDFGDTAEGLNFLAMEFIDGPPLSELLEQEGGTLDPPRAALIISGVAEALEAAHAKGIVHRDLKPANIMLTASPDGSEMVKVVDFGIAKAAAGGEGQDVTRVGLVAGTPQYMSPEHISGDEPDPRSDIYSLAVVLFRALTGALPYEADTQAQLLRSILTEPPRTLKGARPDLEFPPALQAVLDRAFQRDPAQRWRSAREFARAVSEVVSGELPPTRVFQPEPRRTIPVWAMAGFGGVLAVGTVVAFLMVVLGDRGPGPPSSIQVEPAFTQIASGTTVQLSARVTDSENQPVEDADVYWESADSTVASVGAGGLVTGVRPGRTEILAGVASVVGSAEITVGPGVATSLDVTPTSSRLRPGQTVTLEATVLDAGGNTLHSPEIAWSSDPRSVATVDSLGVVRGVAEGSATVTARAGAAEGVALVTVMASTPPGPVVTADQAPGLLQALLGNLSAQSSRRWLLESRGTAQAAWDLGERLDSETRALAAYLIGSTSDLLGDRSGTEIERWLQTAVDLDPDRNSYRQVLQRFRERRR
jgi:serine/threonine protein kinase